MKKKRRRGNPDHVRKRNMPAPENAEIAARLTDLVSPLVYYSDPIWIGNRFPKETCSQSK
jgi:hypothetical protein